MRTGTPYQLPTAKLHFDDVSCIDGLALFPGRLFHSANCDILALHCSTFNLVRFFVCGDS